MTRCIAAAVFVLSATAGTTAQTQLAPGEQRAPANAPYVTGTGATVDKPGVPQASGPTKLDRGIQRQDNKIDNSICKGC